MSFFRWKNTKSKIFLSSQGSIGDTEKTEDTKDRKALDEESSCVQKTPKLLLEIHEAGGQEDGNQAVFDKTISVIIDLLRVNSVDITMTSRNAAGGIMISNKYSSKRKIMIYVATTGRTLCMNDSDGNKSKPEKATTNLMYTAVKFDQEVIGLITVSRNNTDKMSYFSESDEHSLEAIALTLGSALERSRSLQVMLKEKRRYEALIAIVRAQASGQTLEEILKGTVPVVCELLGCDLASLYLVDHVKKEAVVFASNDDDHNGMIKFGEGETGTFLGSTDDHVIANSNLLDPALDNYDGIIAKTMMCVALRSGKDKDNAAAMIQVINKRGGLHYDSYDEESLVLLCSELSKTLRYKVIELQELQTAATFLFHQEEILNLTSFLSEFGSKTAKLQKSHIISPGISRQPSRIEQSCDEIKLCRYITDYNTDPFLIDDKTLIDLAIAMLQSFNLIERLDLNVEKLYDFFGAVYSNYRQNVDFHTFKHAWGTMHLTYQILCNGAVELMSSLHILAVLIAAICHDLDHPGNNSAFEVATMSKISVLYSNDTVLERHHCAIALRLLSTPEYDFLENLTLSDKSKFRKIVIDSIMATDMSQHFILLAKLIDYSSSDRNRKMVDDRTMLAQVIVHSADIGLYLSIYIPCMYMYGYIFIHSCKVEIKYKQSLSLCVHCLLH
jgi:dual 3',5'-cyclic-AMP and -GMP phosphodiesterase 11